MSSSTIEKYKVALTSEGHQKNKLIFERFPSISKGATAIVTITNDGTKTVNIGNIISMKSKTSETNEDFILHTVFILIRHNTGTDDTIGGLNSIDDYRYFKSFFSIEKIS